MTAVIDFWAPVLPTPELVSHLQDGNFPQAMLGYLRVFFKTDLETWLKRLGRGLAVEAFVAHMDEAGIARTMITGFDERTIAGCTFVPNALVTKAVEAFPERFIPFAGVDILQGMKSVRELQRLVRDEGFQGLSLRPFMINLPASDRRYYPFYAKCIELDIPVSVHASANWTEVLDSDLGHPRHFDTVACDFPELKLIMSHAGYPWVLESILLAWKHPNLYLELAAHRPRYLAEPGTGWEPLFRFGNTTIQDKVLFGSGSLLLGQLPGPILEEFKALPIRPETMQKWLSGNAHTLLSRHQDDGTPTGSQRATASRPAVGMGPSGRGAGTSS